MRRNIRRTTVCVPPDQTVSGNILFLLVEMNKSSRFDAGRTCQRSYVGRPGIARPRPGRQHGQRIVARLPVGQVGGKTPVCTLLPRPLVAYA